MTEFKEGDVIVKIGYINKYIIVGLEGFYVKIREICSFGLSSVRFMDAEMVETDYVKVGRWVFDEMTIGVEVDDG